MATVSGNILTSGIRGKIGEMLVFRQIGGKTFASRAPRKPDKRKESAAQRNTRTTFKDASRWAKSIIRDPEKKAYYKKRAQEWKLTNAYTAAIKDYMRSAQSKTINEIAELKLHVVVVEWSCASNPIAIGTKKSKFRTYLEHLATRQAGTLTSTPSPRDVPPLISWRSLSDNRSRQLCC